MNPKEVGERRSKLQLLEGILERRPFTAISQRKPLSNKFFLLSDQAGSGFSCGERGYFGRPMLIGMPTDREDLVFLYSRDLVQFNFSSWGVFLTTIQITARELSLCSLCVVMIMEMTILKKHFLSFLVFMTVTGAS